MQPLWKTEKHPARIISGGIENGTQSNGETGPPRTWASILKQSTADISQTNEMGAEKQNVYKDVKKEAVVEEDGEDKKLKERLRVKYDGPHFVRIGGQLKSC